MPGNIEQVSWLRNAMPYINRHRNKTFVIGLSGSFFDAKHFKDTIEDIGLLHCLGIKLVIVYGTRPRISNYLTKQQHTAKIVNGIRVTDSNALQAAKIAAGDARFDIESLLSSGIKQSPLAGAKVRVTSGNFITAQPLGVLDGVDYQYTGRVRKVDKQSLSSLMDIGNIVLISPLGYSPSGETFSLRFHELTSKVATALGADKLIYMSDQKIRRGRKSAPELTCQQALDIAQKTKPETTVLLNHCVDAVRNNVKRAHIVPQDQSGSLLLELFTQDGIGTLITAANYEQLTTATIDDVPGILALIRPLEQQGVLIKRSREKLEAEVSRFIVIKRDESIIGCAAFYPYVEDKLAEVACIAVSEAYRDHHRGESLLKTIETHAKSLGIGELFVMTTQTAHWFVEKGFVQGDKKDLPMAKKQLYNYHRNAKVFFKSIL